MGRFGVSPTRGKQSDYHPARVTVAVLTFIPELEGYYRHRLDVLRACLESIQRHTEGEYDLMVFDNDSCEQVVSYLSSLHRSGDVDILMLSSRNLGKIGALQVMFNAAPGELIAYCDDDILFYPGWLSAHLEVIDTYPNVGMVSGLPVRSAFDRAVETNSAFIEQAPGGLKVRTERWIPDDWEQDWARSTGRDPDAHIESQRDHQDTLLSLNGVEAYPAANHFQYLAPRQALLQAMPREWSGKLMGKMVELDQSIDRQGLLRLSTRQRYVRHIGNVVSPDLAGELKTMGIDIEGRAVSRRERRHWILNIPRMRLLLEKLYGKLYDILNHVRIG
jgi:hypothetical protein